MYNRIKTLLQVGKFRARVDNFRANQGIYPLTDSEYQQLEPLIVKAYSAHMNEEDIEFNIQLMKDPRYQRSAEQAMKVMVTLMDLIAEEAMKTEHSNTVTKNERTFN